MTVLAFKSDKLRSGMPPDASGFVAASLAAYVGWWIGCLPESLNAGGDKDPTSTWLEKTQSLASVCSIFVEWVNKHGTIETRSLEWWEGVKDTYRKRLLECFNLGDLLSFNEGHCFHLAVEMGLTMVIREGDLLPLDYIFPACTEHPHAVSLVTKRIEGTSSEDEWETFDVNTDPEDFPDDRGHFRVTLNCQIPTLGWLELYSSSSLASVVEVGKALFPKLQWTDCYTMPLGG